MSLSDASLIHNFLTTRKAKVRPEWIHFMQENLPIGINRNEQRDVNNWIWDQFLQDDLSLVALPCLQLVKNKDFHGEIVLQVQKTINISQSFYSQVNSLKEELNGLKGRLISNEDEDFKEDFHESGSFCKYILSDGHDCIYCIFLDSSLKLEIGWKVEVNWNDVEHYEEENIFFIKKMAIISNYTFNTSKQAKLDLLNSLLNSNQSS